MRQPMYWRDKRVFITGCNGFLGSWLTKELVATGAHVVGLVRDSIPKSNLVSFDVEDDITIVRGSLEDYFLLERTINEYDVDTVFHVAAQAIVGTANANPLSTFEANIKGTWNVLDACRRNPRVKRVLVASSDKAYGNHQQLPYKEDFALRGQHPYDVSKSCTDLLAATYYQTYGLPVCITRCANLFGGGDRNLSRLIPGTILSVLHGERPVLRSDGTSVRDYLYIKDATNAYMTLAEKMDDSTLHGHAFNFASESKLSVLDMTQHILRLMDREDLQPMIMNQGANEISRQYLCADKAKEVLSWTPSFTIEQGLKETIDWYREYSNMKLIKQLVS